MAVAKGANSVNSTNGGKNIIWGVTFQPKFLCPPGWCCEGLSCVLNTINVNKQKGLACVSNCLICRVAALGNLGLKLYADKEASGNWIGWSRDLRQWYLLEGITV